MYSAIFFSILYGCTLLTSLVTAADLRADLREFVALLPRRRIGYIAARHFVVDSHFRQALTYLRDPEFVLTWQEIRDSPEFHKITAYLAATVPNATDLNSLINNIPTRLRAFRLPAQVPIKVLTFERNLSSFLKEVMTSLPRSRIANFMARKVLEGEDFAQLYRALRRDEFRRLVDETKNSPNLTQAIARLSQHSINIDDLVETVFSILKWGPST